MTRAVRLIAALTLAAGAFTLTGCSDDAGAPVADVSGGFADGCYPPLACGPMYPVAVYPYYAHPYLGYLHDPAHVIITGGGSRTVVVYRPYSAPLRPAFRPVPPRYAPAATGARPAAPKPPAARPAAPAPRPAAPRVSSRK
jgi:hypothetical protein